MGRKPSPGYQKALDLFLESDGKMPLVEIGRQVGKSQEQIRKWKSEKKWDDLLEKEREKGNVTKRKSNVTKTKPPQKLPPDERGTSPPKQQDADDEDGPDLTPRQLLFVKHYAASNNATQAAMAAGYSEKSASQLGYQLLQKPSIQQAVHDARQPILGKFDAKADDIISMLAEIGLARDSVTGQPVRDSAQMRALQLLAQINGLLKPKDGPRGGNITVVFDPAMEDDS